MLPGICPTIMEHHIDTWPDTLPVRKKKLQLHPSKAEEINQEINKLHKAGFIYLIAYTSWVSNPIPVMKKQGTIHVCTNFQDPKKTYPKDIYPTPFIDQFIDAFTGHKALSFMDGF